MKRLGMWSYVLNFATRNAQNFLVAVLRDFLVLCFHGLPAGVCCESLGSLAMLEEGDTVW